MSQLISIEFREVQGWFAEMIQRRYNLPSSPLIINGEVAGVECLKRVNLFQERPGFDVGATLTPSWWRGLTLTAASIDYRYAAQ